MPHNDAKEAVLIWTCEQCGWSCAVPMPGYPGDGYRHYTDTSGCGPLVARRAPGFLRMRPDASTRAVNTVVKIAVRTAMLKGQLP